MRYGLPYKGSKNSIAEWVVDNLPKAETFVDLFFGGGAITHRAMLTGKYKQFIVNDIDARLPKLFLECAYGKHTVENHSEWVSREEFDRLKDDDIYTALVWSFGNGKTNYIYGKEVEDFKKQLHRAVFTGEVEGLRQYGFNVKMSGKTPSERYPVIRRQIKRQKHERRHIELQSFESLGRLEALERLQSLEALERLQAFGTDYREVPIPDGSLIYCDIPYSDTDCSGYGGGSFDHDSFYRWAEQQNNIFISEYTMPSDFIEIANIEKSVLCGLNNSNKAIERLYVNRKTYDSLSDDFKTVIATNTAEQITLTDYLEEVFGNGQI